MKRTTTLMGVLVSVLLLFVPVASAERLSEEEFSIELPGSCGAAQKHEQKVESPSGPIDVVSYVAKADDGSACIVIYSELSGPITDPESAIDSNRDSLLGQLGVQVEAEKPITVSDFEGRSMQFTTTDPRPVFGRADFVVADDRLYQVIYIGYSQDSRMAMESSEFFNTLQIEAPAMAAEEMVEVPETVEAETAANSNL